MTSDKTVINLSTNDCCNFNCGKILKMWYSKLKKLLRIHDLKKDIDFPALSLLRVSQKEVWNPPTMWETQVWSLGWKIPWRREWQPTPASLPGDLHGQRSLTGYSPWGHKELDTTEQLTLSLSWMEAVCVKSFWKVRYGHVQGQSKKWRFSDLVRLDAGQTLLPLDALLVRHFGGSREPALGGCFDLLCYSLISKLEKQSLILW